MKKTDPTPLSVEVLTYREIHELPGDWGPDALRALLAELEVDFEGTDDSDLLDLTLMGLGDLEPDEAGIAVLGAVFGDSMGAGLRSNLAADLEDDRPWENFADLSRQEGIFTASVLLQKAFPNLFGKPDATRVELVFDARNAEEAEALVEAPAAVILRAMAPGLGSRSIVTRLYDEGLRSGPFPEAEGILWKYALRQNPEDPKRVLAEIFGAQSFLGPLDDANPWQVEVQLRTE